jgi:hypothetical protein
LEVKVEHPLHVKVALENHILPLEVKVELQPPFAPFTVALETDPLPLKVELENYNGERGTRSPIPTTK